jgi:MOSC domain-containing protein YiiM
VAIHLRPASRLPTVPVERVRAIADQGLDGDHAGGGTRQVTILSLRGWRAACAELGQELDPALRRANLVVDEADGFVLGNCIGSSITIGDVVIDVLGETRPCELLDGKPTAETVATTAPGSRRGLCQALRPERRGGVYGRIRVGGELRRGDALRLLA